MGFADRLYLYLKFVTKGFLRHPGIGILYSGIKYYPAWERHLKPGRNPVSDRMPWVAFSAIEFLKKVVRPEMAVFEYGSGGSTLFWASRVKELVSVEHDRPWFEKIRQELDRQRLTNVRYVLKEATPDPEPGKKDFRVPGDYVSDDKDYAGKNFEDYVRTIDGYPDGYFDIIAVDGRARPSSIAHAIKKLKTGGWLLVDNTEREYYLAPFNFDRQSWKTYVFYGAVPYMHHFSETTILKKYN